MRIERLEEEAAAVTDLPDGLRGKPTSRQSVDLDALSRSSIDTLRSLWTTAYGIEPLARLSRELLVRGIAYRVQEQARGGVSKSTLRTLERIARSNKAPPGSNRSASTRPGTRLVREWQGRVYEVLVVEDGFLWKGSTYGSLSEIARRITGTRWSGPRFFGLQDKGAAKR